MADYVVRRGASVMGGAAHGSAADYDVSSTSPLFWRREAVMTKPGVRQRGSR